MSNHTTRHERKSEGMEASPSMLIDVQIQQPRGDCPIYTWEHERGAMRLTGVHHGQSRLPADLAVFQLEGQLELPILVLTSYSSPPGTLVQARILGVVVNNAAVEHERYG